MASDQTVAIQSTEWSWIVRLYSLKISKEERAIAIEQKHTQETAYVPLEMMVF